MSTTDAIRAMHRRPLARWPRLITSLALAVTSIHCGGDQPTSPAPVATRVRITAQPTDAAAGSVIAPAVKVEIQDAQGNIVTSSTATITLSILDGSGTVGAVLGGTTSRPASSGTATFDNLTIDKVGTGYLLTASAVDLAGDVTALFAVEPGAASTLTFTVQPSNAIATAQLAPAIEVTIRDPYGNTVTSASDTVALAISPSTGTSGATLGGTWKRAAIAGVATFNDLAIDLSGDGYTLAATSTGVSPAVSAAFNVVPWVGSGTVVHLQSDLGDYVGGSGSSYQYTKADAVIHFDPVGGLLTIGVAGDESWSGFFKLPSSMTTFQPGVYNDLTRYPFHDPAVGGLSWYGEGRGCNTLTGWIAIDTARYVSGALAVLHLRFEQHCEGGAAALHGTVHWDANDPTSPPGPVFPVPTGLWQPAAGTTPATGNFVYLVSDSGDYIGEGQTELMTPADAVINASATAGHLHVGAAGWDGDFQAMTSIDQLQAGYYPSLHRYPFHNPVRGGVNWSGRGRGCNTLTGWFAIDSLTYVGTTLVAIDLRFEQHCEGLAAALHGAVHWTQ